MGAVDVAVEVVVSVEEGAGSLVVLVEDMVVLIAWGHRTGQAERSPLGATAA